MCSNALDDDTLLLTFIALRQWDLVHASHVCHRWRKLITRTALLWCDVHDEPSYGLHHYNAPFYIALARSQRADIRLIDDSRGFTSRSLKKHLVRTTGLVMKCDATDVEPEPFSTAGSDLPKYINSTTLPSLQHLSIHRILFPIDSLESLTLRTLQVDIYDDGPSLNSLVRKFCKQPLTDLSLRFWSTSQRQFSELPRDVVDRLSSLTYVRIQGRRPPYQHSGLAHTTPLQLLALPIPNVTVFDQWIDHYITDIATPLRKAATSLSSGPADPPIWTVDVAHHNYDDFGRPAGLNLFRMTVKSSHGLERTVVCKWESILAEALSNALAAEETQQLVLRGLIAWSALAEACSYTVSAAGYKLRELVLMISQKSRSHHLDQNLATLLRTTHRSRGNLATALPYLRTVILRAKPFEQVNVEIGELLQLLQKLGLLQSDRTSEVRTAGVWLYGNLSDMPMPDHITLDTHVYEHPKQI
ncbi:hypothetical protein BKA62DRAFT_710940 [Auriculariales sp. MPI-PUGE-AT-0066]|nr:hypothetical protein BKA62DRAFT_710940 [Auriculariales sp. MPI-PUGE-AT-0066]